MQQLSVSSAVVYLLFTGLLFYLCAPILQSITAPNTAIAEEYLRQTSHTLQAVIIREEMLIFAPTFRSVPAVTDGQAVPAGAPMFIGDGDSVLTPESGIYIGETDGFEHLTSDTLREVMPSDIDALFSDSSAKDTQSGKLICGSEWLLAAAADTETASMLQEGSSVTLTVQTQPPLEVTAVVTRISPEESGRCAVVFRCIDHLQQIARLRHLTVSLFPARLQGLRIPSDAIQTDEGGTFVFKLSASTAEKTYVTILFEEEGFCILSKDSSAYALHAGDKIIIGDPDLKEGQPTPQRREQPK